MKKLFTLLTKTLLVAVCLLGGASSAWADANTTLISGITLPSTPTTSYDLSTGNVVWSGTGASTKYLIKLDANGNGIMQASAGKYGTTSATRTFGNGVSDGTDNSWNTSSTTWSTKDGSIFFGSSAYTTSENDTYVNFARRGNLRTNRTFAFRFTGAGGFSALVMSQGDTDGAAAVLAVYELNTSTGALTSAGSASSKAKAVDVVTVDGLDKTKTYVAYIYGANTSNGELYEIAFLAPPSGPRISASPTSVTLAATESGVAVNGSFTITGSELTDGTYDLTIPSVSGLSVSPTSFKVTGGTVSQVINLSYSSTVNVAPNSINITATVDEQNLSVAVNYSASVAVWELQTISTAKTWDFSKLTGGKQYSGSDLTTEHVYANISEIGYSDDSFDKIALAFTGEYPLRDGKGNAQNGTLRFNTSVPGSIRVTFSDTGTSASSTATKRYLVVNGKTTEYWASREKTGDGAYAAQLNVTTDEIYVPAGNVTIGGTSALVYSKVEFTPVTPPASVTATIGATGWTTFSSVYPLNLSAMTTSEGSVTAYYASAASGSSVTMTSTASTGVAAGEGLALKGTVGAIVTIPVAASGDAISGNKLKGCINSTILTSNANYYVLVSKGGTAQFQCLDINGATIPAGKAYLDLTGVTLAPTLNIVFENETSGINAVNGEGFTVNGPVYDLQGRRVAQPNKGLYIVNGKKVLIK